MIVLGIESTAHTLSIGIEKNGHILSNVIDMFHVSNEGMIPRKLADHHSSVFSTVFATALSQANIAFEDVDLIAFSQGPGIGAPLSFGVGMAKFLSQKHDKEIIGVNHPYAHVEISKHLTGLSNPLVLYVSGGNTQLLVQNHFSYSVLGETLDIGIGNMFDSFARAIKMEHCHGSALSKLASGGSYFPLPYSVKGMNLVFSGLQTAAERAAQIHAPRDVAYSLMETAFAMTVEVTERALFLTKKKQLVVCGGVAQNRRLQEMLSLMCKEDSVRFGVASDEYNRDNGAMIAYAGSLLYKKFGPMNLDDCNPITNYRIDQMVKLFSSGSY
ncbi:tRNA (adenosine(37)-N6)-threonylcarbamoyltransferase complex transferase subunit TsaD [Candidatus Micrarchaeota archaeon]|nr:tRNA (adenosine(37)-N6)-threonylcarbamoyltransferase complex transferase subunit TsaD [Candidatus Micrarchaeota archaeon]